MLNKLQSSETIKLPEESYALITNEVEVTAELNDLFSNAVTNLKILKFENFDLLSRNVYHPLKAIVKHRNHFRVIAIVSEFTKEWSFLNTVAVEDALKEISMLDSSKAMQATDIPVKVIKTYSNSFVEQICPYFNESISKGNF